MEIKLKKIAPVFSTRPRAHEIFDSVNGVRTIRLDFSDVQKATPSFLHEALLIFQSKDIEPEFENMSVSLKFQLDKAYNALD